MKTFKLLFIVLIFTLASCSSYQHVNCFGARYGGNHSVKAHSFNLNGIMARK